MQHPFPLETSCCFTSVSRSSFCGPANNFAYSSEACCSHRVLSLRRYAFRSVGRLFLFTAPFHVSKYSSKILSSQCHCPFLKHLCKLFYPDTFDLYHETTQFSSHSMLFNDNIRCLTASGFFHHFYACRKSWDSSSTRGSRSV